MAKRKIRRRSFSLTPIHPSLQYVLFLVMALILIVIVTLVMQQATTATRARLVCPNSPADPVKFVEELSRRCPAGVQYTKDNNGCSLWVCRLPETSTPPAAR